jgi:nicotinate-nucleotide--dimethylbenzimidazole phosphoribosyltransferase
MGAMTDLAAIAADVPWPDHDAERDARERGRADLGRLDELAQWLSGVQAKYPPDDFERARAVIFAGDHGIAEAGVSASEPGATARWVAETAGGSGLVNVLADLAGASVRVVDIAVDDDATPEYRVRRGSGRIDREDALAPDEVLAAIDAGVRVADEEIDGGADLLIAGQLGVGATTAAAVLVSVATNTEPVKVVGRGSGIDDETWMRKATAVRDARLRAWTHRATPIDLLASAAGADIAAISGFLIRAASRRTPVLLDGVVVAAAALVAQELQPRCVRWWRVGQRTSEPAQAIALRRLGLEPLVDLRVNTGDGSGALLALPLLRAAARATRALAADD